MLHLNHTDMIASADNVELEIQYSWQDLQAITNKDLELLILAIIQMPKLQLLKLENITRDGCKEKSSCSIENLGLLKLVISTSYKVQLTLMGIIILRLKKWHNSCKPERYWKQKYLKYRAKSKEKISSSEICRKNDGKLAQNQNMWEIIWIIIFFCPGLIILIWEYCSIPVIN